MLFIHDNVGNVYVYIRYPYWFLSKEIIQGNDVNSFSTEEKEKFLSQALKKPSGKLSSSRNFLPDGRFVQDYYLHHSRKFLNKMHVVGFTVNVEHCKGGEFH